MYLNKDIFKDKVSALQGPAEAFPPQGPSSKSVPSPLSVLGVFKCRSVMAWPRSLTEGEKEGERERTREGDKAG